MNATAALNPQVTEAAWPSDGLELLGRCPCCHGSGRQLLHAELGDHIFHCAPGSWSMVRCTDCGSGYLDPRPSENTIGLAYAEYYTHAANPEPVWLSSSTRGRPVAILAQRLPESPLSPSTPGSVFPRGAHSCCGCSHTRASSPSVTSGTSPHRLRAAACSTSAAVTAISSRLPAGSGTAAEGLEFDQPGRRRRTLFRSDRSSRQLAPNGPSVRSLGRDHAQPGDRTRPRSGRVVAGNRPPAAPRGHPVVGHPQRRCTGSCPLRPALAWTRAAPASRRLLQPGAAKLPGRGRLRRTFGSGRPAR
jgi:hypothetical protein